jgi:sulfur-oxidizing protein SoxY|tara:strand:+ start:1175 stop:1960 length:786 start_codon:yes stop_codon:yes gene_type:complete
MDTNLKSMVLIKILLFSSLLSLSLFAKSEANPELWQYIHEKMFDNKEIITADFIRISGPKRASSGAQVPVTIQLAEKEGIEMKQIFLIIDGNPVQHAATYQLTKKTQSLNLSTRIRMETDSFVRVVGESTDGKLYMSQVAIRASGGCSGYMDSTDPQHTADLGKILLKSKNRYVTTRIKHPNFTGLMKDSINGWYVPEWYVNDVAFSFNGEKILNVKSGISISQDPYIKFSFKTKNSGKLTVQATDTKGETFTLEKIVFKL